MANVRNDRADAAGSTVVSPCAKISLNVLRRRQTDKDRQRQKQSRKSRGQTVVLHAFYGLIKRERGDGESMLSDVSSDTTLLCTTRRMHNVINSHKC